MRSRPRWFVPAASLLAVAAIAIGGGTFLMNAGVIRSPGGPFDGIVEEACRTHLMTDLLPDGTQIERGRSAIMTEAEEWELYFDRQDGAESEESQQAREEIIAYSEQRYDDGLLDGRVTLVYLESMRIDDGHTAGEELFICEARVEFDPAAVTQSVSDASVTSTFAHIEGRAIVNLVRSRI